VARDGEDALRRVRLEGEHRDGPRPDLILLDLNLPRKDGREVLRELKQSPDPELRRIPVVVLTTSGLERDILSAYEQHANAYITKPVDLDQFVSVVNAIEAFWLTAVKLPDGQ
jgi:CheY-like chemotaxis protein